MREDSILQIDQAALGLIHALEKYANDLECCMDMKHMAALRLELINLRRALLGVEMGMLYQDKEWDEKVLEKAVATEKIPLDKVAEKVANELNQDKKKTWNSAS